MKMKVVEGKNDKDRIVWLNDDLIEELNSWKERQTEEIRDCNYIFTTHNGDPLQPTYVQNMIYNYAEKAGIQEETTKHYRDEDGNKLDEIYKEKKVSVHTLRHTLATDLYRETKDLRVVQKVLGHADISTTQIYTHLVDDDVKEGMKNLRKNINS